MKNAKAAVERFTPCGEAREWLDGRSPYLAWRQCHRGDWMLWIAAHLEIDRKLIALAACDCAETALKFVPEGEDRPRIAIETTRAWCRGEATIGDVRKARRAAAAPSSWILSVKK